MSDVEQLWCWEQGGLIHCAALLPGTDPMFATNYFTNNERSKVCALVLSETVPPEDEWKGPDFANGILCMYDNWITRREAASLSPWNQRSSFEAATCPDCLNHQNYYQEAIEP